MEFIKKKNSIDLNISNKRRGERHEKDSNIYPRMSRGLSKERKKLRPLIWKQNVSSVSSSNLLTYAGLFHFQKF